MGPAGSSKHNGVDGTSRGQNGGLRRGLVEADILEHSAQLFAARGFAATSVQDIADALGLSRPALYHYFNSKDEILARLIDGLVDSAGAAVGGIQESRAPADQRLRQLVAALIAPIAESPGRFRLILTSDATVNADAQGRLRTLERNVVGTLYSVISDGISAGQFRRCDERIATFSVLGMINWVAWWYSPERGIDTGELCAGIADLAVASLRADGHSRGDQPAEVIGAIRRELGHLERLLEGVEDRR